MSEAKGHANIALSDDLQRLLKRKVESGQFPSAEAVVEEALRSYLIEEPDKEHPGGELRNRTSGGTSAWSFHRGSDGRCASGLPENRPGGRLPLSS